MTHPLPQTASPAQGEADDPTDAPPLSAALGRASRYVALLAACLATGGSLFFSEVLGWLPCTLCWYQRIAMYPLAVLLATGILRRDNGLYLLILPLALPGAAISLYHYLLIKTDWFPPPPCQAGVPCTVDYLNLLGFINIPFLALSAFLIIALMMVVAQIAPFAALDAGAPTGPRALLAPAALPVYAIIILVVGAFAVGAQLI